MDINIHIPGIIVQGGLVGLAIGTVLALAFAAFGELVNGMISLGGGTGKFARNFLKACAAMAALCVPLGGGIAVATGSLLATAAGVLLVLTLLSYAGKVFRRH